MSTPLTTLDERAQYIGEEAVKMLLERLKDNGMPARRISVPPNLVIRKSCKAVS